MSSTDDKEIQDRFEPSNPDLYERFVELFMQVYGYTAEEVVPGVQEQIKNILKNEKDLLEKFETFLPGGGKG